MNRSMIAATFVVAALVFSAAHPASACNPKEDPTCDRGVPTLPGPAACDPKVDPTCD